MARCTLVTAALLVACLLSLVRASSAVSPALGLRRQLQQSAASAASPSAGGGLTTSGASIVDAAGNKVELRGVNWYGFDGPDTMVQGLDYGSSSLSQDFATVVYRQQLLGFNAVRLPFGFIDLALPPVNRYIKPCTWASMADIRASVIPPGTSVPASKALPPLKAPPPGWGSGLCNAYLPTDSTLNRFGWVANFYAQNGFYVVIDFHAARANDTDLYDAPAFVDKWAALVDALLGSYPGLRGRILLDLVNEPDSYRYTRWEAAQAKPSDGEYFNTLGARPSLTQLYLDLMDRIWASKVARPGDLLFMVQGTGQDQYYNVAWGSAFLTDRAILAAVQPTGYYPFNMSDPNPFFTALLAKPYLKQVVLGPHSYGPTVTGVNVDTQRWWNGANLTRALTNTFGYLTAQGYCPGGTPVSGPAAPSAPKANSSSAASAGGSVAAASADPAAPAGRRLAQAAAAPATASSGVAQAGAGCHVFAAVVGETGSKFEDPRDLEWWPQWMQWANNAAPFDDGRHALVTSWMYWSWNPWSTDTEGLVDLDTWTTLQWQRLDRLSGGGRKYALHLGLVPWYLS